MVSTSLTVENQYEDSEQKLEKVSYGESITTLELKVLEMYLKGDL